MIKEHDRVALISDIPAEGFMAGDVATVVHIYPENKAYELEFVALDGKTLSVVTVDATAVRPVNAREITHGRQVALS